MRYFGKHYGKLLLASVFLVLATGPTAFGSTIMGSVYDSKRNALSNVNVELENDYHALIQHTTSDGIGRFNFEDIHDGRYYVKVMPFRYDMDEQSQMVEINTISQNAAREGFMTAQVEFILTPRSGTLGAARLDVLFAQEIPPEAKKAYEAGMKEYKRGKLEEGIAGLEQAVKIFPAYFVANHVLGELYMSKNDFERAAPALIRATDVNPKSALTLYNLGYSLYKLHYNKAAVIALKAAAVGAPASSAVFTALGSAQFMERDYLSAETNLLQAKKLAKEPDPEIFRQLANVYGETSQYAKAADNLEQFVKLAPLPEPDKVKYRERIKALKQKVGAKT